MKKHVLFVAALLFGGLLGGTSAQAQWPGYGGLNDIFAANMRADANFNSWAWQQSQWLAKNCSKAELDAVFNPTALNRINQETSDAYARYRTGMYQNSDRTSAAMDNYSRMQRGQALYRNNATGRYYNLPYQSGNYYINAQGYAVPGYSGYYPNLYQVR